MAQNWRDQLSSDDPKVRAQAIKMIALSGDLDKLPYLKAIVENDPDPRVQEYAKKAARHLYESAKSTAPMEEEIPPPDPRPTLEAEQATDQIQTEEPEYSISQSDVRAAEELVQRAFSLHTAERTQRAIQVFGQALELNPELHKVAFARSVAAELTGKTPDEGLRILKDPDDRNELISSVKGKSKKS